MDEEKIREDEPLEHADAADCNPDAPGTEFEGGSREGDAAECEYSWREEIQETFEPEPMIMVAHPEDGMPVPAGETSEIKYAHPFTIDTCICVEDERSWVEEFGEEVGLHNFPWNKECVAARRRWSILGEKVERRIFSPEQVTTWFGKHVVREENTHPVTRGLAVIPVRPVRERCRHYGRMVMANDDIPGPTEPGHQIIFRNCSARRSVGGAYMTVSNEAVYACDYRDPPDRPSCEKYLDSRDRERLASKRHLEMVPLFGLLG
jgi:hypothetical protein